MLFFYITIRRGESIQEGTMINISYFVWPILCQVATCLSRDILILDTKEVNRIIGGGIDKVGAKFTLMFAFQEISCQTLAVLL